jgi:protein involved in polysaccharide export with SLBB domain
MMFRLLAALVLAATVTPAAAQTADTIAVDAVTLRPGDVLRIAVWRQPPEWSGDFAIAADGSISHPLYRSIRVTGVPLSNVETEFRQLLGRFDENPNFVLQPLVRVVVMGEVQQPNLYRLPPATTVAEALALAGGPTERARLGSVRFIRDGHERSLDLRDTSGEITRIEVRSGDQILVPRRSAIFRDVLAPAASLLAAVGWLVNLTVK